MKGNFSFTVNKGWGILFLLGAAAFLASKLGFFEGIGFWSILLSIVLVSILISNLVKRSWGGILFSLAFLVIVNDEFLNLEAITPWPVLGAALLGTVGLNLLFPKFNRHNTDFKLIRGGEYLPKIDRSGDRISYENVFGSTVKYVVGEVSQVYLDNAFGSTEVYFTDAVLKDHAANVKIDSAFGRVVLYVPRGWQVIDNNAEVVFGGVDSDHENNSEGENILYITGEVCFGALVIRSV